MKSLQILFISIALMGSGTVLGQTFFTRNGYIGFFSKTPLEDIKAENRQVLAVIDLTKQQLAFTCLLKGFLFKKQLMQEHFNENYVESDEYPKASFEGQFSGAVGNLASKTKINVAGDLTLHGVTKRINVTATLQMQGDKLLASSSFQLIPSDFDIKIPSLVRDKIAGQIDVAVNVECNKK